MGVCVLYWVSLHAPQVLRSYENFKYLLFSFVMILTLRLREDKIKQAKCGIPI